MTEINGSEYIQGFYRGRLEGAELERERSKKSNEMLGVLGSISASVPDQNKKDVPTREELLRAEALKAAATFLNIDDYSEEQLFEFADECLKYIKGWVE
jgi:hypothetical protein